MCALLCFALRPEVQLQKDSQKRIRATFYRGSRVKHCRLLFNSVYNIWNINMHVKTQITANQRFEEVKKMLQIKARERKNELRS